MSTSAVRRRAATRPPLVRKAYQHILCRPHTAGTLARSLGISVASANRVLAELRRAMAREGNVLVSVKEGASWRYEIRERDADPWESDPFARAVGFATRARRPQGESADDALYGRPRKAR